MWQYGNVSTRESKGVDVRRLGTCVVQLRNRTRRTCILALYSQHRELRYSELNGYCQQEFTIKGY